jgi:hypothetical protein
VTASVYAPGFAFRFLRVQPKRDVATDLAIDAGGGTLIVESPVSRGALRPWLLHNGGAFMAQTVAYLSHARLLADPVAKVHFETPSMEQGLYSLCWMTPDEARLGDAALIPAGRCSSGTLARGGVLTLRMAD